QAQAQAARRTPWPLDGGGNPRHSARCREGRGQSAKGSRHRDRGAIQGDRARRADQATENQAPPAEIRLMIILDSDVLSEAIRANRVVLSWLDLQPRESVWTTAITILEIRFGLAVAPSGRLQAPREVAFARLLSESLEGRVLSFDRAAAEEAAPLMAARSRA